MKVSPKIISKRNNMQRTLVYPYPLKKNTSCQEMRPTSAVMRTPAFPRQDKMIPVVDIPVLSFNGWAEGSAAFNCLARKAGVQNRMINTMPSAINKHP